MPRESHFFSDDGRKIEGWIPAPDNFPTEQTPEEVQRILHEAKTGDYAHVFPKGPKQIFCIENNFPRAYGVVQDGSPKEKITLWGTVFALGVRRLTDEERTFGVSDIEIIDLTKAEEYIPRESNGKFEYLSRAKATDSRGSYDVTIDTYYEGLVSGLTPDGQRLTGGSIQFRPIKKPRSPKKK